MQNSLCRERKKAIAAVLTKPRVLPVPHLSGMNRVVLGRQIGLCRAYLTRHRDAIRTHY